MAIYFLSKHYDKEQDEVINDGLEVLSKILDTGVYKKILLVSERPRLQIVKGRDYFKGIEYIDIDYFNIDNLFTLNNDGTLSYRYDCVFILGCRCKIRLLNVKPLFDRNDTVDFYLSLYETPIEDIRPFITEGNLI